MSEPRTPEDEEASTQAAEPHFQLSLAQRERIAKGLRAADEGRFASPEAVRKLVQKYIPNG